MKKKIIYLWVDNEGWMPFDFDNCKDELTKRKIRIGDGCKLGYGCKLGDGCTLGYDCTLGYGCKLGYGCTLGYGCKPLSVVYIAGTNHAVTWWGENKIQIGCHGKSIEEWINDYKKIGESEDYSEEQIEEYGQYIQMIASLAKKEVPA